MTRGHRPPSAQPEARESARVRSRRALPGDRRCLRVVASRDARDTSPAYFRCNSARALRRLCATAELELESVEYLGQYPSYFLFDPLLFALASAYEKLISRFHALRFLRGWLLVSIRKP